MNIKKILKESLENYNDTWMADETKKKAYAKGFAIDCTCAVQNGDIPRGCGIWDDEVGI